MNYNAEGRCSHCLVIWFWKQSLFLIAGRTSNSKDQNTCYHNKKPKSVPGHVLFSKMFRYVLFSVTSVFKSYKELCDGGNSEIITAHLGQPGGLFSGLLNLSFLILLAPLRSLFRFLLLLQCLENLAIWQGKQLTTAEVGKLRPVGPV